MLQVQQAELQPLTALFGDREQAIRNGIKIDGKRYEVTHSFHASMMLLLRPIYIMHVMPEDYRDMHELLATKCHHERQRCFTGPDQHSDGFAVRNVTQAHVLIGLE